MTRAEVIALYFEGDHSLFDEYRQACQLQFAKDITDGDAACARQDMPVMRHLGHGLKTVLQTLGRSELSALAKSIEESAQANHKSAVLATWQVLREALLGAIADD